MSEKAIFVGNGKVHKFKDGGECLNIGICLTDLGEVPEKFIRKAKNEKQYIGLVVSKNRNGEDEYGYTHYVKVDQFVPDLAKSEKKKIGRRRF